jgi:Uma2 family endonuclease
MSEVPVIDLATVPPDADSNVLYEIVDGEYQEIEWMGAYEGTLASYLNHLINAFAVTKKLGLAVNEVLFALREDPQLQRRPDVAFVSYDRWPEQPDAPGEAWDTVPDLAIEIVSPTNRAAEIDQKIGDYFGAGVRQVWVLYPQTRRTYVFTSPTETTVYNADDLIPGGDVLPGFELRINDLFAPLTKPASDQGA